MKSSNPSVYFNNIPVSSTSVHKHLGMLLDGKLSYEHHLKFILSKVNKAIGLLRKFQQILPIQSLITIYKSFIRPHLDYGDIVYDRALNESFHIFWIYTFFFIRKTFIRKWASKALRKC